jgi:hypothetical protein
MGTQSTPLHSTTQHNTTLHYTTLQPSMQPLSLSGKHHCPTIADTIYSHYTLHTHRLTLLPRRALQVRPQHPRVQREHQVQNSDYDQGIHVCVCVCVYVYAPERGLIICPRTRSVLTKNATLGPKPPQFHYSWLFALKNGGMKQ